MILHVLVVPDEDVWFAQGVEIDYAAQGDFITGAVEFFEGGLIATIKANIDRFGNANLVKR